MTTRTFLYTVRTTSGITFHIEARTLREAEARATHPALTREIARMLRNALSQVQSVEPHRGPVHTMGGKLVFRDEVFGPPEH